MPYTREIATAQRLIAKKGRTVTVRRPSTGATMTPSAVLLPNLGTLGSSFDEAFSNDSRVQKSSRRVIMAAKNCTFAPEPDDEVTMGAGRRMTIVSAVGLAPDDGPAILYTCAVNV